MYLLSLSGGVSARVAFAACQEKKYRIRRYMRQIRFWEVKASWIFLYSLQNPVYEILEEFLRHSTSYSAAYGGNK